MKNLAKLLATALITCCSTHSAMANLIGNGSFESTSVPLTTNGICTTYQSVYPYSYCEATGWSGLYQIGNSQTIGIQGSSFSIPQPDPDGSNALIIQTFFNQVSPSASTTFTSPAGGDYFLNLYAANRAYSSSYGPQDLMFFVDGGNTPVLTLTNLPFSWAQYSTTFHLGGGVHTLTIAGLTTSTKDVTAFVDNISLTAVPIPGAYALFVSGLLLISAKAFRSKSARADVT